MKLFVRLAVAASAVATADAVFAIDVDGDGDIDIISGSSLSTSGLSWFENDGSESFTEHSVGGELGDRRLAEAEQRERRRLREAQRRDPRARVAPRADFAPRPARAPTIEPVFEDPVFDEGAIKAENAELKRRIALLEENARLTQRFHDARA